MTTPLRILHLEDDPADAELVAATLASDGLVCEFVRAASRAQFLTAIEDSYDLILADFAIPGFDGITAQRLAHKRHPHVPFVFISGTMGEEVAIERLQEGATDYVLKQRLQRLPSAVRRALQEAHDRRERLKAELAVRQLNAELEARVTERTAQLARANASLQDREAELEQAKAFLEHLIAASPSMIFRFDAHDLRVTYVSPNIGWLLGYTREEVIGVPGFWEEIIHPDDRARVVGRLRAALDDTVAQLEQEYRCRGKDGRYRWFFNLLRIDYDADARPAGILGYALDIADRKAAEADVQQANAFLDSIIESLPVTLFVKDAADLRYVRFNRAGEELLGLPRAEVIGRTDLDIHPKEMAEAQQIVDRSVLEGHTVVDIAEQVIETRARGPRVLHTRKLPILDTSGVPRYLLGIAEDITERKAAEEDARLARLEAERANHAKSDFLSRMSHDLRTPLNAVIGFAQLLEMDALPDQQRESVTQILNGGRHLLDLINEVLDVARIEAGQLSLSPEPVVVAEVVQQVVDLLAPLGRPREVAIDADLDRAHPACVRADRQRLKQVLLNLVGNAV
jgi:PAS domain S-box-containing protein